MKTKGLFALLALVLCFALGCACAEEAENPVLASTADGSIELRKSDMQPEFDEMLTYYLYQYSSMGYSVDEYDQEFQASVATVTAQSMASRKAMELWAANNGYTLTAEREAELQAESEENIAKMREQIGTMFKTYYGSTDEDLEKMVDDYMAEGNFTLETMMDSARFNDLLDFAETEATKDVAITEEDVRAAYDEKLASQQESYKDVNAYLTAAQNGEEILWTPEGVRRVQLIYVLNK